MQLTPTRWTLQERMHINRGDVLKTPYGGRSDRH
jgi:hypothetical protein